MVEVRRFKRKRKRKRGRREEENLKQEKEHERELGGDYRRKRRWLSPPFLLPSEKEEKSEG